LEGIDIVESMVSHGPSSAVGIQEYFQEILHGSHGESRGYLCLYLRTTEGRKERQQIENEGDFFEFCKNGEKAAAQKISKIEKGKVKELA